MGKYTKGVVMFLVNKYMDTFVESLNNNTETLTKKLLEIRTKNI